MNRSKILELFGQAKWHLENKRPSHQLGPLHPAFTVTMATPDSIQQEAESPEKAEFMQIIIDLLAEAPTTEENRNHLLKAVSTGYNFGLPAEQVLGALGSVDQDDWSLFDPAGYPEEEEKALSFSLKEIFLNMTGALSFMISEEREAKMDENQAAGTFVLVMTGKPPGEGEWPPVNQFREFLNRGKDISHFQWTGYFERIEQLRRWIGQYQELVGDPEAFNFIKDLLKFFLDYKVALEPEG